MLLVLLFAVVVQGAHVRVSGFPEGPRYPAQCITPSDLAGIRERCSVGWAPCISAAPKVCTPIPSVDECVQQYCNMLVPAAAGVGPLPTNRGQCVDASCKRYRLGWDFWTNKLVGVLVKFQSSNYPEGTEWFILPSLRMDVDGFQEASAPPITGLNVDVYLPDLGDLTRVHVEISADGTKTRLADLTARFSTGGKVHLEAYDEDRYYEIGFNGVYGRAGTQSVSDESQEMHKKWKYYDLVNPHPVCKENGLCATPTTLVPGYDDEVPSWAERYEITYINSYRTDPQGSLDRYRWLESNVLECGVAPDEPKEAQYYDGRSIEAARFHAAELVEGCTGGHGTCPRSESMILAAAFDNTDINRMEVFHVYPCGAEEIVCRPGHLDCDPRLPCEDTEEAKYAQAWKAEAVCVAQNCLISDPGHCGAILGGGDAQGRRMRGAGAYPKLDDEGAVTYAGFTHINFYGYVPWNDPARDFHQPLSSGAHFYAPYPNEDPSKLRFVATYYARDGEACEAMELVLDGEVIEMTLKFGTNVFGSYEVEVDVPHEGSPTVAGWSAGTCRSYFFRARQGPSSPIRVHLLPQSGLFNYRTFSVLGCTENHEVANNRDESWNCCHKEGMPSASPTCWDGTLNGDETGIDCGGGSCDACVDWTSDCVDPRNGPSGELCSNGGVCVDHTPGDGFFMCDCRGTGHAGSNCEISPGDCSQDLLNVCRNLNSCVDDVPGDGNFTCDCPDDPPYCESVKVTGAIFGLDEGGFYGGNSYTNMFDKNINTVYDANLADGTYAGMEFTAPVALKGLRYHVRLNNAGRARDGVFGGTNGDRTDRSSYTEVFIISDITKVWHTVLFDPPITTAYKSWAFWGADGSHGNLAEVEWLLADDACDAPDVPGSSNAGECAGTPHKGVCSLECASGLITTGDMQCFAGRWSFGACEAAVPDCSATSNGPNGQGCAPGTCVDGTPGDSAFTCNCLGSGYEGDNCETEVVAPPTSTSGTATSTSGTATSTSRTATSTSGAASSASSSAAGSTTGVAGEVGGASGTYPAPLLLLVVVVAVVFSF